MLLWFAGLSFIIVWQVFQSPAVDYRLVMLGALLPLVDIGVGGSTAAHSLMASAVVLLAVMVLARGRRLLQRRLVGIPIGMLLHLALSGSWGDATVFWWPLMGADLTGHSLGLLDRPLAVLVVMEVVGAAALMWCWQAFGLADPQRRRRFVTTGQLDRDLLRGDASC